MGGTMDASITVKVGKNLHKDFVSFCAKQGRSTNSVVRLFLSYYARTGRADFCYSLQDIKEPGETQKSVFLVGRELRNTFKEAAANDPTVISMSDLIRAYMRYCVKKNAFPKELALGMAKQEKTKNKLETAVMEIEKIQKVVASGECGCNAQSGEVFVAQLDCVKTLIAEIANTL